MIKVSFTNQQSVAAPANIRFRCTDQITFSSRAHLMFFGFVGSTPGFIILISVKITGFVLSKFCNLYSYNCIVSCLITVKHKR